MYAQRLARSLFMKLDVAVDSAQSPRTDTNLDCFGYLADFRFISHFPHENTANAPVSRAEKTALVLANRRNTNVMFRRVKELEDAWVSVPDPKGWWEDHGFACSSCTCCRPRIAEVPSFVHHSN